MSGQNHRRLESLLIRDTVRATKQKPWLQVIEEKLDAILAKLAVEDASGESTIAIVDAGSGGVAAAGKPVSSTKKETK